MLVSVHNCSSRSACITSKWAQRSYYSECWSPSLSYRIRTKLFEIYMTDRSYSFFFPIYCLYNEKRFIILHFSSHVHVILLRDFDMYMSYFYGRKITENSYVVNDKILEFSMEKKRWKSLAEKNIYIIKTWKNRNRKFSALRSKANRIYIRQLRFPSRRPTL